MNLPTTGPPCPSCGLPVEEITTTRDERQGLRRWVCVYVGCSQGIWTELADDKGPITG